MGAASKKESLENLTTADMQTIAQTAQAAQHYAQNVAAEVEVGFLMPEEFSAALECIETELEAALSALRSAKARFARKVR